MALSLSKVSKTFYKGTNDERIALDDVSLELSEGTFAVVIGSNGAGKSTLLNVISGQLPLDAGSVRIDGARWLVKTCPRRADLARDGSQRGTWFR
jgi:putative ABC transport system ATP-binding protein